MRIGNGAAKQRQLDVYGQLVEAAYLFAKAGGRITPDNWNFLVGLADIVADVVARAGPGHLGDPRRAAALRALEAQLLGGARPRGAGSPTTRKLPGAGRALGGGARRAPRLSAGRREQRGWFSQAVGSDAPDASALLVPAMGFLPTTHPLVQKTIDVVRAELGDGALVHRYHAPDGLEGGEGAFLLCSFWLLDCLTTPDGSTRPSSCSPSSTATRTTSGCGPRRSTPASGEALGNFPQAFTHMAHITSSLHLEAARDGEIDFDAAYDYAEHAVGRLLEAGRGLSAS